MGLHALVRSRRKGGSPGLARCDSCAWTELDGQFGELILVNSRVVVFESRTVSFCAVEGRNRGAPADSTAWSRPHPRGPTLRGVARSDLSGC